jgi:hypothetical protein
VTTHTWDGSQKIELADESDEEISAVIVGSRWNPARPTQGPAIAVTVARSLRRLNLQVGKDQTARLSIRGAGRDLRINLKGGGKSRSNIEIETQRLSHIRAGNIRVLLSHPDQKRLNNVEEISVIESSLILRLTTTKRLRAENSSIELQSVVVGELSVSKGYRFRTTAFNSIISRLQGVGLLAENSPIVLEPESTLAVGSCSDLSLIIAENSELVVTGAAHNLTVGGRGHLNLQGGGDSVSLKQPISISVGDHRRLTRTSGRAALRDVSHAWISARPDTRPSLEITDVTSESGVEATSLSGVTFPLDSRGIRVMRTLAANAMTVTPGVHKGLPGLRSRDRRPFARLGRDRKELSDSNQYAISLAQLARGRDASSNARTKLDWAAYRMRNLATSNPIERAVLSCYRLIGYGERFLPSAGTYIAAAFFATVVSLSDLSFNPTATGLRFFLNAWATWLVSPFEILSVKPEILIPGDLLPPLQTVLQVAIAVPFVTSVLALRKYARGTTDVS